MKQNKLILLLLICSLLPMQAHAGWKETALKIFSGGKTAATSVAEGQLPVQTAATRSAVAQITTTAIPSTVTSAALAPLHLQLPPMPTTSDLSVAYETTARLTQQFSQAGKLSRKMPPAMATAAAIKYDFDTRLMAAKSDNEKLPLIGSMVSHPVTYKTVRNSLRPKDMYPGEQPLVERILPILKRSMVHKFADNQNAVYTHFTTQVAPEMRKQIDVLRPQFEQVANYWAEHQPAIPAAWAAQQVPADTDNLIIGETHLDYIPQQMIPMLDVLIEKMKGREIIFLTEFLPKGHVLNLKRDIAQFKKQGRTVNVRNYPLWTALTERNIPVIGLEPAFVDGTVENKSLATEASFCITYQGEPCSMADYGIWGLPEGRRIRNAHWLEEIRKQRAAHPDAFFIIYAGSGHTITWEPFSIVREIEGKNFAIESHPANEKDDFDYSVFPTKMPDCFVLEDPQLVQAAGFNLRIKLNNPK